MRSLWYGSGPASIIRTFLMRRAWEKLVNICKDHNLFTLAKRNCASHIIIAHKKSFGKAIANNTSLSQNYEWRPQTNSLLAITRELFCAIMCCSWVGKNYFNTITLIVNHCNDDALKRRTLTSLCWFFWQLICRKLIKRWVCKKALLFK